MVKLSLLYITTGKTIALSMRTILGKVMSFNFMAAVTVHSDFGGQGNKSVTVSIISPSICHEEMGPDLSFLNVDF